MIIANILILGINLIFAFQGSGVSAFCAGLMTYLVVEDLLKVKRKKK